MRLPKEGQKKATHPPKENAFIEKNPPFWLPSATVTDKGMTSFETYLTSSAAESWVNRWRLARDVAVGLYQWRTVNVRYAYITWNTDQLFLDPQGRAQLTLLASETPMTNAQDVFALGQFIWQIASRKMRLPENWQQGVGLPEDCPPMLKALIQECARPDISARPTLKAVAKGLDMFWQNIQRGLPDTLPVSSEKKEEPLISEDERTTISTSHLMGILLVADHKISWLSTKDPRYQVSAKLCALRDYWLTSTEFKSSSSALQTEIQQTLLAPSSKVEILHCLSEDGKDTQAMLIQTARRLWQTPEWERYRPGDPPPARAWVPLLVREDRTSLCLTQMVDLPSSVPAFTETEWQVLQNHYSLLWLMQGGKELSNIYRENALYRAKGHTRLLLYSRFSDAFLRDEMTDFMPHSANGRLLPAHYARYVAPGDNLNRWSGRYQGELGSKALDDTTPSKIPLKPVKDLSLDIDELKWEKETVFASGASGYLYRGKYYGQPVAVKCFSIDFKEEFRADRRATLKHEVAVMAGLESDFLVRVLGYSLPQRLLVMELFPHSLADILKDQSHELPWPLRYRLLRDIAVGLLTLHTNDPILLHCDLKSANILVDADSRAILADFQTTAFIPQSIAVAGTLYYMAPETINFFSLGPATRKNDVYSFGIVCWEIATRSIIKKSEHLLTLRKGCWPSIEGAQCPQELITLTLACCKEKPEQRPDIQQILQVLEGLWQDAVKKEQLSVSPKPAMPVTDGDFHSLLAENKNLPLLWQGISSPAFTVGVKLRSLRQAVLTDADTIQELSCYIEPNGQSRPGVGQPVEPLYPWVKAALLQASAQVLLLQGAAGAGKSTFSRQLLRTLWEDPIWKSYRAGDPPPTTFIPLLIPLNSSQVKPNDLWDYYRHLPEINFTTAEIEILRRDYRHFWIADGHDEMSEQTIQNLYHLNHLDEKGRCVKLLISGRRTLIPHTTEGKPDVSHYQIRYVSPFTPTQIQDYITQYSARLRLTPATRLSTRALITAGGPGVLSPSRHLSFVKAYIQGNINFLTLT
jgi:serine/threonine protein kinase